jgi:drug/metabolite transporter (DMT)-like permease
MGSPPGTAPTSAVATRPALLWVALAIVYLVWGSTYLAIRLTVETLPPLLSAAARFSLAAVVLAAILLVRRRRAGLRVRPRQLASAALVGVLLLAGGNGLVVVAQSGNPPVPSGIAALLVATVPLIIILLRSAYGDRPALATVGGVVVGLVGLAILVLPAGGVPAAPVGGALTVLAAAVSWALGSVLTARLPMPADPFVATVYEMVAGAAALVAGGLLRAEHVGLDLGAVSMRSWLGLGYLVVAGSLVAFTAYVWLLQNAPISLVSTYAYVNPVVAVLLGALLVDEAVTGRVVVGGAVIVAAVAVVVTTERPRRAGSDQP